MDADLRAKALSLCEAVRADYAISPWREVHKVMLALRRALLASPEASASVPSEDAPGAACSKCGEAFPSLRHREECVAAPSPPAPDTLAERDWKHDIAPGQVPEHSCVIGGVLCRWWGEKEPPGVAQLTRALRSRPDAGARSPAVPQHIGGRRQGREA